MKSRTQSYAVCDYETGERLGGAPTAELVRESLSREPTGAVGAYLAGGEWRWLDDSDPAPCGAADCRTVYVVEVERRTHEARDEFRALCEARGLSPEEQETAILSIGSEFLPPCARSVRDGGAAGLAYWEWLLEQMADEI